MPVIVNAKAQHPFLPSLGDFSAIEIERAKHQDIRPLEVVILNLMADKYTTERQLATWLGHTPLQVNLTFACTDDYVKAIRNGRYSYNTSSDHIKKFYNGFSDIKDLKFDGLVVTGINALQTEIEDASLWPDVRTIFDWSKTHVFSSLFLCWGAQAALKHFFNVDSLQQEKKIFGLFDHRIVLDSTGLLRGFPDVFPIPISRWQSSRKSDIHQLQELEIVATFHDNEPSILVESQPYEQGHRHYPRRIYMLSHPEYETMTLKDEYERDRLLIEGAPLPENYFPGNNPTLTPTNTWRYTASIYANWIKAIYESTPYNLSAIPEAFHQTHLWHTPLSKKSL